METRDQHPGRRRFAAVALLVLAACTPAPELRLTDGWVRAMPPGTPMSAAYGSLHWRGSEPLVVAAWHSDAYADVSLHRTVQREGVSRMEAAPPAIIPPDGRLILEPGGLHLMLMRPSRDINPGDSIGITVVSDSGRSFRFDLPVEAR